jgi:iron complex transport system permease protein
LIPRNFQVFWFICLVFLLLVLSGVSLFLGVADSSSFILWHSRVPRTLAVLLIGAGMGTAGLIMQRIGRNSFVSPETAGTVDSAVLGFILSLVLFPGSSVGTRFALSSTVALAGSLFFMMLIRGMGIRNDASLPLTGMIFGGVVQGIAQIIAYQFDLQQTLSSWIIGDFSLTIAGRYEVLFLIIPVFGVSYGFAHHITLAGMGKDSAVSLGLNYERTTRFSLVIVSLISALGVIVVGRIPYLGLIVPNIISHTYGDHLKTTLPITALFGALLLLSADIFSRLIIRPYEMPVGLTMGILGSLVFLWLMRNVGNHRNG